MGLSEKEGKGGSVRGGKNKHFKRNCEKIYTLDREKKVTLNNRV